MSRELSQVGHPSYGSTAGTDHEQVMFSGESREIRMLCESISTNIYTINSNARNMRGALATLGTNRDTQSLRNQIHVWQIAANQVIKSTTSEVGKLARLARSANKVQKLQADKITNHFKEAVKGCTDVEMAVAKKLKLTLPRQTSVTDDTSESAALMENETRQQLQLQTQLQFENEMLAEREQRINEIESEITDVNQLMRELGAIVHEQGEVVTTIETTVENAMGNVAAGDAELTAAARIQNKTRRRNFILLVLLVIVLAVLIGIIAWSASR